MNVLYMGNDVDITVDTFPCFVIFAPTINVVNIFFIVMRAFRLN